MNRTHYYRRVFSSYLARKKSQLSFWHEVPEANPDAFGGGLGPYYMAFKGKACYGGPFDDEGIPLLDYRGRVGKQYNPIAIAQYALANYNLAAKGEAKRWDVFFANARWLLDERIANDRGLWLWPHYFDFEYFRPLKAPWFSGLAQGQGLSVLTRAYAKTKDQAYLVAADEAFQSFRAPIDKGGVLSYDKRGLPWIEEYLVDPPTHILNGCIWALWGVYDYALLTGHDRAKALFSSCAEAIAAHLNEYDNGFWSLYEITPQRFKSIASAYYHRLHIVQLRVMHSLTGESVFSEFADRWERYAKNAVCRERARFRKIAFKLAYY